MSIYRIVPAIIAGSTLLVSPVFAQAPAPAAAEATEADELQEVVVTGSRLASGFDTPTPVTMVSVEDLQTAAPNNIGESLAQLPSLAGSVQNTTSGQGSVNSTTNGQNLLNLRQMGSDRTLILLDGQRMGVTNVVGSVDVNIIPQSLVKRVDVVTGGASASYGSDAVAGVVNFILDTTFEGLKVDYNAGITRYSDAENGKITVAYGRKLGERARVVGGLEYFRLNGMTWGDDVGREWHNEPTMSVATGSRPTWLLIPNARSRFGSFGGTIIGVQTPTVAYPGANNQVPACTSAACTALLNQQFLPGGATQLLAPCTNVFGTNAYCTGGGGSIANQAMAPTRVERRGLFLHGEYDLSDDMTLWAEGSSNASETFNKAQVQQSQTTNSFRIFEDNAFLPAALRTSLGTVAGLQSFTVTRYSRDIGYNEVTGNVFVSRLSTGLKGRINDRWTYDATVGYQDSHQDLDAKVAVVRNLYAASDAVVHPVTNQIVCRSQWYNTANQFVAAGTGRDPGCVPMNIFGDGAVSQAAADYVNGTSTGNANRNDVDITQTTADLNFRGDLGDSISLGAGPISIATGLNYRKLEAERAVDALSAIYKDLTGIRGAPFNTTGTLGGYTYGVATPFAGEVTVKEGYLEFGVPLLRDVKGIRELSTTLAGRATDYSQSGMSYMWKTGLNWTINDSLRIRGTVSADTRAPSVVELFNSAQISRGTYTAPWLRTVSLQGQNVTTGNPNLTPEDAKTFTAGFVVSPVSLPGFQASVDWYKINLLGSIGAPGGQDVIDRCYAGDQEYCAMLRINGQAVTGIAQTLTTADFIEARLANRNEETDTYTSGIDVETSYRMPLGSGNLNLRLNGLYLLDDYNSNNGCTAGALGKKSDLVGAIGACGTNPKIRGRLSVGYNVGRFTVNLQERYIHSGLRNPNYLDGFDISDNTVPAIMYTDTSFRYGLESLFGAAGEVYLNVTNVFDKDPPPTNSTAGRSWIDPTEEGLYDVLGRRYVLGMRLNW